MVTKVSGNDTSTFGGDVDVTGSINHDMPMFSVTNTANQTLSDNVWTKTVLNSVIFDTHNVFDETTNYRFTVPTGQGGKYMLYARIRHDSGISNMITSIVELYKNGSNYRRTYFNADASNSRAFHHTFSTIIELNEGDYIEVYNIVNVESGTTTVNSSQQYTEFSGYRLI